MEKKFVVVTIKERLALWRELADAAEQAEGELAQTGLSGASAELPGLLMRAKMLRDKANREFAAITRAITTDDSPSSPDRHADAHGGDDGRKLH